MRLALLGCDDEAVWLVQSALAGGRHVLVAAYDTGQQRQELRQLAPLARYDDHWELLLAGTDAEAVIVARGKFDVSLESGLSGDERRADQLRKLASAAVPMLIVHPACEMIVGYEVEMIRAGSGGIILPFTPELYHPAIHELQSLTDDEASPLGVIEQVTLERQMNDRGRSAVLTQFARDASLVRRILSTIRQVAATGPAGTEYRDPLGPRSASPPSLANLTVHLSGTRPFPARWSVGPVQDSPGARMTIIGARGRAALQMPGDPSEAWILEVSINERQRVEYPDFNPCQDSLERLETALAERDSSSAWLDACRDVEAASVIDRSLEKGRAMELYTEEVTEEQSFKGVMAVGGCLVLAVTLLGLGIVVLVEALQLELRRSPLWRMWPVFLVTPILVFLILQTLQIVAKRSNASDRQPRNGN